MACILVSLVSEQTIPNLLLMKELSGVDKYLLISTKAMEEKDRSTCIIAASGLPEEQFKRILVQEDVLSSIDEQLRALFRRRSTSSDDPFLCNTDEFIVNLTGGTKIMSIATYNCFKERNSKIYYIPIGKNQYFQIYPEIPSGEHPINYRVDIPTYLTAYGVTIENSKKIYSVKKDADQTQRFFDCYIKAAPSDLELIDSLREYRKKKIAIAEVDGLASFLERFSFRPSDPENLSKDDVKYLTGDWFEEYVFSLFKSKLQFSDKYIATGINIRRRQTPNEFDVMFMLQNNLHVIECKTSIGDGDKSILVETLYKSAALRKDFGLAAKTYLFTLTEGGKEKTQIKPGDIDRGRMLGVDIIDRGILLDQNKLDGFFQKLR
ncbi:MAG: DUF1887 family protein [Acidobacteria bacterium]|nr:DUF1887 family protein [Acidobacteriota bacterium]